MLMGTFHHNMDTKGRVHFPAKLREGLGDRFFITKGLDGCLFVYPEDEWEVLGAKIRAIPLSKGRRLQRFFFSGATDAEPDKQGRILIPQNLREYANLDKEVVVIGASNRAEIWDKALWDEANIELTDEAVLETMDEIGF